MSSLLHLQGIIIYKITEDEKSFKIKIGQPRAPVKCVNCGSKNFIKNGKGRIREIRHGLAINGKAIYLFWNSKRFRCKECKKSWTTKPPDDLVDGRKRSTKHCRSQALRTLQTNSFRNTHKQTGLSYGTLREILHSFMKTKPLIEIPDEGDLTLGIDEHTRLKRRLATTITLIRPKKELLGLIPQATSVELIKWVNENMTQDQRLRVTEISMDMTKSLRKQLVRLFPNAQFVMDHFHVIAYLNNLMRDEYGFQLKHGGLSEEEKAKLPIRTSGLGIVRLLYQGGAHWKERDKEKIRAVFSVMPRVAELWYAKEEVRAIYRECRDKYEARERWKHVLNLMPDIAQNTLKIRLEEILNYFDNKTTNAFTEGCHTKVKLLKRISFGLKNPQVYVDKLELGFVKPRKLIGTHTY